MKTAKTLIRAGFSKIEAHKLEAEQREIMRLDKHRLSRPVNSHRTAMLLHDGDMTPAEIIAARRGEAADAATYAQRVRFATWPR